MGEGSKFLDDGTEKNQEAVVKAATSTSNVERIASKPSQTAQITTSKTKK